MGTEWVKVERIGLEEDSHEKEKKIKFDSRTRQNVAFTKLGLVMAQVHVLSYSSVTAAPGAISSQTSLCFSFLPWGMETGTAPAGRIIEGPQLH